MQGERGVDSTKKVVTHVSACLWSIGCRCILDSNSSSGVQQAVIGVQCVLSDDSVCGDECVDFTLLKDKVKNIAGS